MEQPEPLSPVRELIDRLRRPTFRTRVGVWCMPLDYIGQEPDVAVLLGIEAVDVREPILQQLPEGTRFVRLTPEKIFAALDNIANNIGKKDCVLVYNVDLLLAGLTRERRQSVWQGLFDGLPHRSRALVVAIPASAERLLPTAQLLEALQRDERLVQHNPG